MLRGNYAFPPSRLREQAVGRERVLSRITSVAVASRRKGRIEIARSYISAESGADGCAIHPDNSLPGAKEEWGRSGAGVGVELANTHLPVLASAPPSTYIAT